VNRAAQAAVAALAVVLSSCIGSPAPTSGPVELRVYAAASLKDALEFSAQAYHADVPSVTVTISTDSSTALRTQIEHGAPADLFLSADTTNPQALVEAGLTSGDAVPFARNVLTIVVPAANPAGIGTPADLATVGVKIVAAGDDVPISTYAGQLIDNLAALPGYPSGFAAACAGNVVSREDNVRAIVAKIDLGEGDAGIVYATDALAATNVASVAIPADANVTATYAGVVVKASRSVVAAQAFLDWLAGPRGQTILQDFGFHPRP
jgi:molybdate transport system substrate-binding protein